MASRQSVGILSRIGIGRVITLMCGHQTQAMIYIQRVGIIYNLDTFAYILFWYTVMVKPEGDVAVPHYRCGASFFHLMTYDGKWAEAVGFNLFKLFPSGQGTSTHPAPVEGRERFGDGRIQRFQRVEYKPLDISIDRAVKQFHGIFHQGLVFWMTYPCGIYGTSIVFGKCCKLLVDYRLVAVATGHGGLEVVRYYPPP